MNFPFYIAKRYLFAKKSQTAVSILAVVAVVGVCVGTMALVVVLSVFNGFEKLILSLFNATNPDIEISLVEGKSFSMDDFPSEELENLPGVWYLGRVIEETALLIYRDRQHIVRIKGVDDNFRRITGLDSLVHEGEYKLQSGDADYFILGQGVAYVLGANINDFLNPLTVYVPRKGRFTTMHPAQAFNASSHFASGVFGVQVEYDMEVVLAPYRLMEQLAEYENRVTSVVLAVDRNVSLRQLQRQIQSIAGDQYVVKNRLQQEEFLYKIMRSEKWAIFFILSFIMIIAAFNITGSLTMLVLEKRKDIGFLWSMGASRRTIQRIFLIEGLLIGIGGAILGILLGWLVSWIQINYGIVNIQAEGTFIIDAYPVEIQGLDLLLVFFTVSIIAIAASWLPASRIKYLINPNSPA